MLLELVFHVGDLGQSGADSRIIVVAPKSPAFVVPLDGVFVERRQEVVDVSEAFVDDVEGVADERRRDRVEEMLDGR